MRNISAYSFFKHPLPDQGFTMQRLAVAITLLLGLTFPAAADGCFICQRDSSCGQYCRYDGQDNAENRKKCAQAGCKIGGTASCPTGANIKTCHAGAAGPLERMQQLATGQR